MSAQDIFNYELKDVPVELIDVGDRKRKDFGDIDVLAADLAEFGLHHPILVLEKKYCNGTLEHREDLDPTKPYLLLAGERRYRAVLKNNWPLVPCKITQRELDDWEIQVIELHENLRRKQMTPVEEAQSKAAIHATYQRIFGVAERGPGGGGHSMADTAKLLGESTATVSQDIEIAKHVDVIPELKDAKTKSEARKLVKDLKDKLVREEIARREEARRKAKAGVQDNRSNEEKRRSLLMERFIVGDFFENTAKIQPRSVDLIELDPDWGINFREALEKRGSLGYKEYEELAPEDYQFGLQKFLQESWRILKDNAWLIVWYSMERWHDVTRQTIIEEGYSVCPMPAFWIHTSNYTGTPAYRLGQRTESFFYARKGNARIAEMGHANTFHARTLSKDERTHPAEKPIELYEELFQTFLGKERKAATIVVPCAGSGNALLAADNLQHNAIGFDTSSRFKDDFVIKVTKGTPGTYKSFH